ncbi:NADH-quinone oxidoreductase subunit NuoF [Mycoplasmatota bacterium WC44]
MIKTKQDLLAIYDQEKIKLEKRVGKVKTDKKELLVCAGTGCVSSKSKQLIENLRQLIKDNNLDVEVHGTGCFGFCEKGPIVKVMPDDTFYCRVKVDDASKIVESHLINGEVYKRKLYANPILKKQVETTKEIPFYAKQMRIALKNCGFINPENINEFIGSGGYQALARSLEMDRDEVINIIKESGLRGRGGGGFPTGLKWEITKKEEGEQKYIICNADEGDPGAFMDRSILEGDPHSVLEAMAIGAYTIGANMGVIYIRAEYPLAVDRLNIAIEQAREMGLLGGNLFGTDFSFDVELRFGAGAFVCGEETALIHSCEGKRGEPNYKPPYPSQMGLWTDPTCVNNVETFANIPSIIMKGADWFNKIGTEKSKGTKVFALGGKIKNTGLIEVPMGITLREIIYDIGGGIPRGNAFKAIQSGGPSGGVLTEKDLDAIIDYDSLLEKGSMMGSGGLIVMDEKDNMVDIAKFYLEFTMDESCGRCTPCRIGTKRLHEILEKISENRGSMKDIEYLKQLSHMVKASSLCGLGQSAPNPILSTLKHFPHEYEAFVNSKDELAGDNPVGTM